MIVLFCFDEYKWQSKRTDNDSNIHIYKQERAPREKLNLVCL